MNSNEFASIVGGKVAKSSETGKERALKRGLASRNESIQIPEFKTNKDREDFYKRYIAGLYFVELTDWDINANGPVTNEMIDEFWTIFNIGVDIFEKLNNRKEENL